MRYDSEAQWYTPVTLKASSYGDGIGGLIGWRGASEGQTLSCLGGLSAKKTGKVWIDRLVHWNPVTGSGAVAKNPSLWSPAGIMNINDAFGRG